MASVTRLLANGHAQQPLPATNRSSLHALRVENVPAPTTKEQLGNQLAHFFGSADHGDIHIRSLAPALSSTSDTSPEELTATVSFVGTGALDQPFGATDEDISIDTGFLGFTPLNRPTEPVVAEWVAFTFLSGHPFESWALSSGKHMWLRDFLPKAIPNVRVLLYGYDCRARASTGFLSPQAADLKLRLSNLQRSHAKRPIIFVGHGVGCLLIKKLLVDVRHQNRTSPSFDVPCVAFFGAPHLGLSHEYLQAFGTALTNNTVRELRSESAVLRDLHDDFCRLRGYLNTLTVYETRETPLLSRGSSEENECVVPQEAAMLRTVGETLIESPADHFQMVKLARTQAGIYYAVEAHLKQALDALDNASLTDISELPSTFVSPEIHPQVSSSAATSQSNGAPHEHTQLRQVSALTPLPDAALTERTNVHPRHSSFHDYSTGSTTWQQPRSSRSQFKGLLAELPPEGTKSVPPPAELPADSPDQPKFKAHSFDGSFQPFKPRRKSTFDGALNGARSLFRMRSDTSSGAEMTNWFSSALENDQHAMRGLLLTGVNVNKGNSVDNGRTALHYAAQQKHLDLVKWLLDKKAKVGMKDQSEQTALHEAAFRGSPEIIDALINASAYVDMTRVDGSTALHLAAEAGQKAAVLALLNARADPGKARYDGRTALQLSIAKGNTEVSKLLQTASNKASQKRENYWPGLN